MPKMIIHENPFRVGLFLVRRVPSSSVRVRIIHEGSWRGYICPQTICTQLISKVGKFIEPTSVQQLKSERDAYRAKLDPFIRPELAYYEVLGDSSA